MTSNHNKQEPSEFDEVLAAILFVQYQLGREHQWLADTDKKHLNSMKVEEYGTVPQKETLDRIMSLITTDRERAVREARIDELKMLEVAKTVIDKPLINIGTEVWLSDRLAALKTNQANDVLTVKPLEEFKKIHGTDTDGGTISRVTLPQLPKRYKLMIKENKYV